MMQLSVWSTIFFPSKQMPDSFGTKFIWVGARSGFGFELESASKVMFCAFFEIPLLIALVPHVGHTKFLDFYILSWIMINSSGKGVFVAIRVE